MSFPTHGICIILIVARLSYIKQTKQSLKFRVKEHEQYIPKQEANATLLISFQLKLSVNPLLFMNLTSSEHLISIKKFDNIINCEFAIPSLSDCRKYYIK